MPKHLCYCYHIKIYKSGKIGFAFSSHDMDNRYPVGISRWAGGIQRDGIKSMRKQKKKNIRLDISLWVSMGAIVILTALLTLMSYMQFQLYKNQAVALFVEKGATLIQSFEAGLRNPPDQQEDIFYLQKRLMETAQQPDIDYMIITDNKGNIIADSDPSLMGKQYGLDLDPGKSARNSQMNWRQTANLEGADTFEVYRGLSIARSATALPAASPRIIFVGFNMEKIQKAERKDTFLMLIMAGALILIGSLAISALFLIQTHRLTRASLSRVTIFSDALVKNMPAALLALDQTGKVVTCNEQAQSFIKGTCREAVGKDVSMVLPDAFSNVLDKVNEKTGLIEEEVVLFPAGNEKQIWEAAAATFADEGVPEGKILLARNMTATRLLEKEVAKSRHLNAIGSLAAGVAHEIRNPLSSIKGFAVYFKGRLAGHPEDEETADMMIAETDRLNRVISQLIEFARPLALKLEPTNLADLAAQTIRLIAADIKSKNISVDVQKADYPPMIPADPDKIKQVLLNIYLNALAAMPEGGKLSIGFETGKNTLALTVSDTGEGIAQENLPRIYDPYFTSKPAGTGLGLAVVQKIMEAHGGTVRIESREKCGTKVTLQFEPAAERKPS